MDPEPEDSHLAENVDRWLQTLHTGDETLRFYAATALGLLRFEPDRVVPELVIALADESTRVRTAAARSLAGFEEGAATAVGELACQLDSSDADLVIACAHALGRIGEHAFSAVPKLVHGLSSANPDVQVAICQGLAGIGQVADVAVPVLETLLCSDDLRVRSAAEDALQQVRGG